MQLLFLFLFVLTALPTQAQRTVCDMSDLEREGYKGKVQYIIKTTRTNYKYAEGVYSLYTNDSYLVTSKDTVYYDRQGSIVLMVGTIRERYHDTIRINLRAEEYSYMDDKRKTTVRIKHGQYVAATLSKSRSCPQPEMMVEQEIFSCIPERSKRTNTYFYSNGILIKKISHPLDKPTNLTSFIYNTQNNIKTETEYYSRSVYETVTNSIHSTDRLGNPATIKRITDSKHSGHTEEHITLQYIYYP